MDKITLLYALAVISFIGIIVCGVQEFVKNRKATRERARLNAQRINEELNNMRGGWE